MGKGKELELGVKESLRDSFRLTRQSLKPTRINIPSKAKEENKIKKSLIRKFFASVNRFHTIKKIFLSPGKQC